MIMYGGKCLENERKRIHAMRFLFDLLDICSQSAEKPQQRAPQVRVVRLEKGLHLRPAQIVAAEKHMGGVSIITHCRLPGGGRHTYRNFGTHGADAACITAHGANAKSQQSHTDQSQRYHANSRVADGEDALGHILPGHLLSPDAPTRMDTSGRPKIRVWLS